LHPDKIGKGLGSASIEPAGPVVAGSKNIWSIRYTVGEAGLDWTGSLRLTVPFGFSVPQYLWVTEPGYLTATVEVPEGSPVRMEFYLPGPVTGDLHPEYLTRWGRLVFLRPVGGGLGRGDVVRIDFGRTPYYPNSGAFAPYFAHRFLFELAVDLEGTGEYLRVVPAPEVTVVGGEATCALVVAPSVVRAGEAIRLRVVPEDGDRNLASTGLGSPVEVFRDWESDPEADVAAVEALDGPVTVDVAAPPEPGVSFWQVEAGGGPAGESNPVLVTPEAPERVLLWGELHAHTRCSDGLGTPAEMYAFARDAAALDFAAGADHIGQMDGDDWEAIQAAAEEANTDGSFLALPGYEINGPLGERNVYFPSAGEGLYRHLVEGHRKESDRLEELLRAGRALMIPHCHGARQGDFDPAIIRLVEIYSLWGAFEYGGGPKPKITGSGGRGETVRDLWARGWRAGVTAGSDCHAGHPGRANWLRHMRAHPGGLTGVWAEGFTREALWAALLERRCYGTTGARIILEFSVDGSPMGSETESAGSRHVIRGRAIAPEPVARVTVVRCGEEIHSQPGDSEDLAIEFADENPPAGTLVYYIRAMTSDGELAWSSPVWID